MNFGRKSFDSKIPCSLSNRTYIQAFGQNFQELHICQKGEIKKL